jgi:MFS family permease
MKPAARSDLRTTIVARSLGIFGDEVAVVALTLSLHDTGAAPWAVAALLSAGLIPIVLLSPLAGHLADRHDSRALLTIAGTAQAVMCTALAYVHGMVAILTLVALLGAVQSVTQATWQALVPRIVGEERLGAATGRIQAGSTLAGVAAPAVAGVLTGTFGSSAALLLDAATFLGIAAAGLLISTRRHESRLRPAGTLAPRDGLLAGTSFLRRDPVVAPLVVGLGVFVLLGVMVNVVEVYLVRDTFGASATWYGMAIATWAAGLIAGSLAAGRLAVTGERVRALVAASVVLSLSLVGFAAAPYLWVILAVSVVGGAANGVINVCAGTVVMTRAPEEIRGRVAASLSAVTSAASVLSLAAGGALASVLTPREVMLAAGALSILAAVVTGPRAIRASSGPVSSLGTRQDGGQTGRQQ